MKLQFTDNAYDILKWLCLIALPALSVLYSALAGVWGWPYAQEVATTINDAVVASWARSSASAPRATTKPMAQASDVLAVATREIGTVEQSGNRQKYGKAYGMDGVYWCMQFVW